MAPFAQIIRIGVDDDGASDDAQVSLQRELFIGDVHLSDAIIAGLYVAQVTSMADSVGGSAVFLAVRVEVGPGGNAAIGIVAELVDMETVEAFAETAQFAGYLDGTACILLFY